MMYRYIMVYISQTIPNQLTINKDDWIPWRQSSRV